MPRPKHAWITPTPPLAVTAAIKGLANGTANPEQQKRALRWVIEDLCGTYGWAYRPLPRETDVALGMQRVGLALVREVNISLTKLKDSEHG